MNFTTPKKMLSGIALMGLVAISAQATAAEKHYIDKHYKLDMWGDNWFSSYIDGDLLLEDPVSITTERSFNAESVEFEAGEHFTLAFILKDFKENDSGLEYIGSRRQQMGDGGFIAQVTDLSTGKRVAVTDNNMRCFVTHRAPLEKSCADEDNPIAGQGACDFQTTPVPLNWTSPNFDDSHWEQAIEYSEAQVSPKHGYNDIDWDKSAQLIWGNDLHQVNTLLCRLTVGESKLSGQTRHTHADPMGEQHSHFAPFTEVKTREEGDYLVIESNGLPQHAMMEGITAWQQQVPIPQNYTGNNAWKVPLTPELANEPLSTKEHFHKGAIAVAVNGVPIFNALNNRGEYSADIGELDQWGGHSGRADDYHYHLAPTHLETIVGEGQPIAYVLDGFPLYGKTHLPLDESLGRFNEEGDYQYHAVDYPPYYVAAIRGKVEADSWANAPEDQIIPQARSKPARTADYGPLRGAEITGFERIGDRHYRLFYSVRGKTQQINYQWDGQGNYTFTYIDASGQETIETYNQANQEARVDTSDNNRRPPQAKATNKRPPKYCGDGICDNTESQSMCPVDC